MYNFLPRFTSLLLVAVEHLVNVFWEKFSPQNDEE